MSSSRLLVCVLACGLCTLSIPASALTLTTSAGPTTSTPGAATFYDFDSIMDTGVGTFSATPMTGLAPDGGNFLGLNNESVTLSLVNPVAYIGFLWGTPSDGSVTPKDELTVYNGATLLGTFDGSDVVGGLFVNLIAGPGEAITSLTLSIAGCCFETDNYAYAYTLDANAVPIGPALPLFASGLGVMGLLGLGRKLKAKALAA